MTFSLFPSLATRGRDEQVLGVKTMAATLLGKLAAAS